MVSGAPRRHDTAVNAGCLLPLVVLLGCATAPPPPPPPPPSPPRASTLELVLDERGVGVRPRDVCEGTLSGAYTVQRPGGLDRVVIAEVALTEQVCIEGLGSSGECRAQPRDWVTLGPADLSAVGEYRVRGPELTLSCAPGRLTVVPARAVVLVAGAPPLTLAEDDLLPPPPPPPPPRVRVDPRTVRARLAGGQPRHEGRLEGLLLPLPTGARTRWGQLHAAPRAPVALLCDGYQPQWLEGPADMLAAGHASLVAVDLDGRDGAASSRGGLVVRAVTPLAVGARAGEGSDVEGTLDDAQRRWMAWREVQTATLAASLATRLDPALGDERRGFGAPTSTIETLYRPAWSSAQGRLVVRYVEQHERTVRAARGRRARQCPPNRPAEQCRVVTTHPTWTARALFALELTYDRAGRLVDESPSVVVFEVFEGPS